MAPAVLGEAVTPIHLYGTSYLMKMQLDSANKYKLPPPTEAQSNSSTSGPQGSIFPGTLVRDSSAWTAKEIKNNPEKWTYILTSEDIEEIRVALALAKNNGVEIKDMTIQDFPLPNLGPKLITFRNEVVNGRGFQIIRGFPVESLTREETVRTYFAFGLYWGNPQPQNKKGHLVGHIKAIGTDGDRATTRPYTTALAQPYHSDSSDIVSLLSLAPAKEGGLSSWTSSVAIHNEMLRRGRQDLVRVLAEGEWFVPTHKYIYEDPPFITEGEDPTYHNFPPFHYHDGYLSIPFSGHLYYKSQKSPDAPKLTELQHEALSIFTSLAKSDDLRMDATLQKGDIQLLNNTTMLHTRSAFTDGEDEEHRRHLLRLWIAPPNGRALPKSYGSSWDSITIGSRGRYYMPSDTTPIVPIHPVFGD